MVRPHLEIRDLSKRFDGHEAVAGATLQVEEGRTLALLGPSGCGKTTLLRLIAGLTPSDSGTVELAGITLTGPGVHVPPEHRKVGMVFQDWALFPHMTVAENVGYGLQGPDAHRRAQRALELVGLSDLGERYPHELSGGQAQRVAVARAIAPEPGVLLLDEPFSNLDTEFRVSLRSEVARIMRDVGMTAVFVTHDQEEAFVVGDTVAVMRAGQILQQGTPTEVYEHPATPWLATFVGEANLVTGDGEGSVAGTVFGDIALAEPRSGACRVVVRPEHLLIDSGDQGTVSAVEFYGHDTSYVVDLPDGPMQVRAMAAPRFRVGDRVSLRYVGPAAVAFAPAEVVRETSLIS
jgi:iron(III) transport system ATP-binding protein